MFKKVTNSIKFVTVLKFAAVLILVLFVVFQWNRRRFTIRNQDFVTEIQQLMEFSVQGWPSEYLSTHVQLSDECEARNVDLDPYKFQAYFGFSEGYYKVTLQGVSNPRVRVVRAGIKKHPSNRRVKSDLRQLVSHLLVESEWITKNHEALDSHRDMRGLAGGLAGMTSAVLREFGIPTQRHYLKVRDYELGYRECPSGLYQLSVSDMRNAEWKVAFDSKGESALNYPYPLENLAIIPGEEINIEQLHVAHNALHECLETLKNVLREEEHKKRRRLGEALEYHALDIEAFNEFNRHVDSRVAEEIFSALLSKGFGPVFHGSKPKGQYTNENGVIVIPCEEFKEGEGGDE